MWAPEEGRGSSSGGGWGKAEGEVAGKGKGKGEAWVGWDVVGGNDEGLRGPEVELFFEDDLEFQIASY